MLHILLSISHFYSCSLSYLFCLSDFLAFSFTPFFLCVLNLSSLILFLMPFILFCMWSLSFFHLWDSLVVAHFWNLIATSIKVSTFLSSTLGFNQQSYSCFKKVPKNSNLWPRTPPMMLSKIVFFPPPLELRSHHTNTKTLCTGLASPCAQWM